MSWEADGNPFFLINRRRALLASAGVALATTIPRLASAREGEALSEAEARAIAREAFLWGMHPVAIYLTRFNAVQNAKNPHLTGINRLGWSRRLSNASDRTATGPNATTIYGGATLDLSADMVVLTVPEIKDRYWSIQFADNYARWWPLMIGSQFDAPGQIKRLIIGPNWNGKLPDGFVGTEIMRSPSDFAVATVRIAVTDDTAEELRLVNGIQDSITLTTVQQWEAAGRKSIRADELPVIKGDYPTFPGMETVKEPGLIKGMEFLRWVSLVLNDKTFTKQVDGYQERNAFLRFERLGLKAGLPFDPSQFSPAIAAAISAGIEDGRAEALALMTRGATAVRNGWEFSTDLGYQDSDWVNRARYGLVGVFGPVPARSHTAAFCLKDARGRLLSGENRYTITFELDKLPPVTEFWEIPVYDRAGYFVDNPINRYSVNSYMLERGKLAAQDGKLVLYIQSEAPGDASQRQNWLPTPKQGGFQFAARFYGPSTSLIDGSYDMPSVVQVA